MVIDLPGLRYLNHGDVLDWFLNQVPLYLVGTNNNNAVMYRNSVYRFIAECIDLGDKKPATELGHIISPLFRFSALVFAGVNILPRNHKLFPYEIFRGHKLEKSKI